MKRPNSIVFRAVLLIAFVQFAAGCGNQESMHFKKGELLYDKSLPKPVVQQIGEAYQADSLFNDSRETTGMFSKKDSVYVLSVVFDTSKLNYGMTDDLLRLSMHCSEDILGGAPVDFVMVDPYKNPEVTLHYRSPGTQLLAKGGRLFYTKSVDAQSALKLKDYLIKTGFFDDKATIAVIDKQADGYHFHLVSGLKAPPSAEKQAAMAEELRQWSTGALGGTPLTVELCDINMKTFCSIRSA